MQMLEFSVNNLNCISEMLPDVQELGRRHTLYGANAQDYNVVGEALLWALGKQLGSNFTPAVREAWLAVYALLASSMKAI